MAHAFKDQYMYIFKGWFQVIVEVFHAYSCSAMHPQSHVDHLLIKPAHPL